MHTVKAALLLACFLSSSVLGQTLLPIYKDSLASGFQDWSWCTRNLASTSPVHSGSRAISATADYYQALSFYHAPINSERYSGVRFWAHGGATGGQRLQVYAQNGDQNSPALALAALTANTWREFVVSMADLGIAGSPDFSRLNIQLRADGTKGTFYIDDIELLPVAVPAVVHATVDASKILQTADERHFGVNLAVWDNNFDPPNDATSASLLREMGATVVRMPGGSLSDEYHWASNKSLNNTWEWANSFRDMVRVCTNAAVGQAFITVNYGTGTADEAAGWVRHANVTNRLAYKYWEIGNECYGSWETDSNTYPHDPFTYATRATNYIARMKAADPSIKIGIVVVPGENSSSNSFSITHPARNLRTGQTNYGWTPVLLATLRSLGVTPDFAVHHVYPQWTDKANPAGSPDNDETLLESTKGWAQDAADLRQLLNDYLGAAGQGVELVCTENNSDAGAQGKQSTSLVNGLYYADSLGSILKTEFRGFVWWDFRNGTDRDGYFGTNVYGWRDYGDLGMVNGLSTRHPTFYAAKLASRFTRPGDAIVESATDFPWLSLYGSKRTNGTLCLLAVNRSLVADLNTQFNIQGFDVGSLGRVHSYGIPNDEAARVGGPAVQQDLTTAWVTNAAGTFTMVLPRMSMSVVELSPPPLLRIDTISIPGKLLLEVQGPASTPCVLETSTDLQAWTPVQTNVLQTTIRSFTDTPGTGSKAYRASWR